MEDDIRKKTTFWIEDDFWWKTPSMEDNIWWKMAPDGRQPSIEDAGVHIFKMMAIFSLKALSDFVTLQERQNYKYWI